MLTSELYVDDRTGEIVTQVPLSSIEHFKPLLELNSKWITPKQCETWEPTGISKSECRIDYRGTKLDKGDIVRNIECPGMWRITGFELQGHPDDGYILMMSCESVYGHDDVTWFACGDVVRLVEVWRADDN